MTSQLPCKQEGWNSLPMILAWLLISWSTSRSELTYPHKNVKAHKDHRYHCTEWKPRCIRLYRKWLGHPGWIKAPRKYWVRQSKSAWLALLGAEGHLQFRGGRQTPEHHLYSPKVCSCSRGVQLTPITPISSHWFCRNKRHGFPCLLPQLVGTSLL